MIRRLPFYSPPPTRIVAWEGPSALDPSVTIRAICTGLGDASHNPKTGEMVQLWIVLRDMAPHEATRSGEDSAVCGLCPKRPSAERNGALPCYVRAFQGPRSVWQASRDQSVDTEGALRAIERSGRAIRLGAYGDPAALPIDLVTALAFAARGHTGYTHQWRQQSAQAFRALLMASADTPGDRDLAHVMGWRTFRAIDRRQVFADLAPNEIFCPSAQGVQCNDCGLCDGSRRAWCGQQDKRKSIAIFEH